ncbi:MAG: hypothetical protein U1E26_11665 [Coriobacteriia bacterium]|nr:hypothetical protein [Coriobacteriia bacterium]
MQYPVVVRGKSPTRYVARALGIPGLRAEAESEQEAVEKVGRALEKWLSTAKLVQVSVPGRFSGNPWEEAFGRSADDPDFQEFDEELRRLRAAANAAPAT